MIQIKKLKKIYNINKINEVVAINDIDLQINDGEYVSIMGPSGAGKTTLVNMMCGLENPTSGEIIIDNQNITKFTNSQKAKFRNDNIGIIMQNFSLINDFTVYENVELPLLLKKVKKDDRLNIIKKLLIELDIFKYANTTVKNLSGGEMQRVAIARGLINCPNYIIADEPTGSLDSEKSDEIIKIFDDLNKQGKTIILITHNLEIAKHAGKIINIKDGKIL